MLNNILKNFSDRLSGINPNEIFHRFPYLKDFLSNAI